MTTVVKVSRQDARLVLTIDRPERRNALNADVIGALQEALHRAKSDDTIRAVVLTGAGDEAFCAGADLGANAFEFDCRRDSRRSSAPSRSSATSLTRPISRARAASIGSPVRQSCVRKRCGTCACSTASTCIGNTPTFASGRPKTACGAAMARSHIASRPMPPAMQAPLTRATSGTLTLRAVRSRSA